MRVLVTGAAGFIGSPLCLRLHSLGFDVSAVVRSESRMIEGLPPSSHHFIPHCDGQTDWSFFLKDQDVVINLLAVTHQHAQDKVPLPEFTDTNVNTLRNLAHQACEARVKQIIHLSTIKVNGEESVKPFTAFDEPAPEDNYGKTKLQGERALKEATRHFPTAYTIIRPPLVYGDDFKGNLLQLQGLIAARLPLPFGQVKNRRDLVSVDNLIDLVIHCMNHPAAKNGLFLVSDNRPISTRELIEVMALRDKRPVRLLSLPVSLLSAGLFLTGKRQLSRKLLGNLEVDISHTMDTLNWQPLGSFLDKSI